MIEGFESQIRKGLLEYAVLLIIDKGLSFSSEIIKSLSEANLITSEGTIYPLLSRLKKNGYCEYVWRESQSGPPRKYYKLSKKGKEYLSKQNKVWKDIIKSINFLEKQNGEQNN